MKILKNNTLFTALALFTRVPIRQCGAVNSSNCLGWFPLIGWLVCLLVGAVAYAFSMFMPLSLAVLCAVYANLWFTGALHEDGLADYFDSLGAHSSKQALEIMQDSRLGSYGAISLIGFLSWRFFVWLELIQGSFLVFVGVLAVAQSLSRLAVVQVVQISQHISLKSHFAWLQPLKLQYYFLAYCLGLLPLILLPAKNLLLVAFLLLSFFFIFVFFLVAHLHRTLKGYTGDCLGMCQTLTEAFVYAAWFLIVALFELVPNYISFNHINHIFSNIG